jgi:hypothetical protein
VWRFVSQSVPGRRHRVDGSNCQDHSLVRFIGDASAGVLIACVADGAGTSPYSSIGSKMACMSIVESAERFANQRTPPPIRREDVIHWCDQARDAIAAEAQTHQQQLRDYASTLCAAVMSPRQSIFFQVGDGAIVARRSGACGVVFWPQSGEYVNTTSFLTSSDYRDRLQVCDVEGRFDDVALLTDGVERLALQFDLQAPHVPFFQPLFAAVRTAGNTDALAPDLKRFLESDSVAKKNDDDKTLLLASRIADEDRHTA